MWLALQFLTHLPVPRIAGFSQLELSRSAGWFPFAGAVVGTAVAAVVWLASPWPLLAGALAVLAWTWITGALHLDGLADLADALAASHRHPDRFLPALRDPHIGAFGTIGIVVVLSMKLACLAELASADIAAMELVPGLALVGAWGRLGPVAWCCWLSPVASGTGERFAWAVTWRPVAGWSVVLLVASAATAPVLAVAPLVLAVWGLWLRERLGGFTGDCLGAGVESVEVVLLVALVLAS
jgi:adenosylcobinamide-GDP ribazoletransferase